jgi:hypothetical protein
MPSKNNSQKTDKNNKKPKITRKKPGEIKEPKIKEPKIKELKIKEPKIKPTYFFSLLNIDIDKIEKLYGIVLLVSNLNMTENQQPNNTTNLSDLYINKNTPEIISFLDESKNEHKCTVSMIDLNSLKPLINNNYNCFWCNHSIPPELIPIGCPIKYIPNQTVKTYISEISKDKYIIKGNITTTQKKKLLNIQDKRLSIIEHDYYLTDGIFCSWNCTMAFIDQNKINPLYILSEMLLLNMYYQMYQIKNITIEKAPSFRLLQKYGGHLSINEFRNSFNKIEYIHHGIITSSLESTTTSSDGKGTIPIQKSISNLFEQSIKF